MSNEAVTVVIAAHTERRFNQLLRAIDSVASEEPAEVIVAVDHNRSLEALVRASRPAVHVVSNTGERGASATRNAGAWRAQTPYIAFLDDDACATPGWLTQLVEPFSDAATVGVGGGVAPDWHRPRPRWFPDEFGWVVGASYVGQPERTAVVRNVWSENMAVRRDRFLDVGGFRNGFGKVGDRSRPEDTDLCIRMSADGSRWIYVPTAVVTHSVPANRSSFRFFVARCWAEGRGKIELRRMLGPSSLTSESAYLRGTLMTAVTKGWRTGGKGGMVTRWSRSSAILAGLTAAAAGAATELLVGSRT